jgi:hypothetical protein
MRAPLPCQNKPGLTRGRVIALRQRPRGDVKMERIGKACRELANWLNDLSACRELRSNYMIQLENDSGTAPDLGECTDTLRGLAYTAVAIIGLRECGAV